MSDEDRKRDEPVQESAAELLRSLSEAYEPGSLDKSVHEMLIEQALSGFGCTPDAEDTVRSVHERPVHLAAVSPLPDQREREAADDLRAAFDGERDHPLLELARALQAAYEPSDLENHGPATAVARALQGPSRRHSSSSHVWPRALAIFALAAGIAFWIGVPRQAPTSMSTARATELAQSRSLSPLFAETIEHASPTERIDRIYAVRSKELRQNRFVTWRVR